MSTGTATRARLSAPAIGILWMIGAAASFAVMSWSIRALKPMGASEVVFVRSLFGLAMLIPWLRRGQVFGALSHPRLKVFALRAVFSYSAMLAWFYALQHVVFADAVALHFTLPLFTILFAVIVYGERVGLRRWTATFIGFAGALVIIRPGFAAVSGASLLVIASAALYGAANMVTKSLRRTESPQLIVFYLHALTLPLALIGAIPYWVWPDWHAVPWIVVLAAMGSLAHYCFSHSIGKADTSVVMPFDYLRLPFLAAIGYLAYGEHPALWTWLGAALIISATFYIARREARLARADAQGTPSPR